MFSATAALSSMVLLVDWIDYEFTYIPKGNELELESGAIRAIAAKCSSMLFAKTPSL